MRITKLESSTQIHSFPFSFSFLICGFCYMCAKHVLAQVICVSSNFFTSSTLNIAKALIIFQFWKWGAAHPQLRADFPIMPLEREKKFVWCGKKCFMIIKWRLQSTLQSSVTAFLVPFRLIGFLKYKISLMSSLKSII